MAEITRETILSALENVEDPDRGQSIVALGMVAGIQIKDGHVAFGIEVEPARGEVLEPMRAAAEKAVHALPGVLTVTAVLTAERAASPPQSQQPAQQEQQGNGGNRSNRGKAVSNCRASMRSSPWPREKAASENRRRR